MKPKPWSISTLDNFVTCPKQYHEVKVLKSVVEVEGEAAKWGNRVHEGLEKDLDGTAPLPPELNHYKPYAESIKKLPGTLYVERKLALTEDLLPCDFMAPNVWVRGKCDALTIDFAEGVARALDHKTGKRKPQSRQMVLMALLIFHHHPEVRVVHTAFFWLKDGKRDTGKFERADIPAMWNMFVPDLQQYNRAFKENIWTPRPSGLCYGWCPVKKCEFSQPFKVKR